MVRQNYKFEKRQRDLAKKKKKEEKRQRKLAKDPSPDLRTQDSGETGNMP